MGLIDQTIENQGLMARMAKEEVGSRDIPKRTLVAYLADAISS